MYLDVGVHEVHVPNPMVVTCLLVVHVQRNITSTCNVCLLLYLSTSLSLSLSLPPPPVPHMHLGIFFGDGTCQVQRWSQTSKREDPSTPVREGKDKGSG